MVKLILRKNICSPKMLMGKRFLNSRGKLFVTHLMKVWMNGMAIFISLEKLLIASKVYIHLILTWDILDM
jgi:hypothetical protein